MCSRSFCLTRGLATAPTSLQNHFIRKMKAIWSIFSHKIRQFTAKKWGNSKELHQNILSSKSYVRLMIAFPQFPWFWYQVWLFDLSLRLKRTDENIAGIPPTPHTQTHTYFSMKSTVCYDSDQMLLQETYKNTFRYVEQRGMWYSLCSSLFFRIRCCSFSFLSSSISFCMCSMLYWEDQKEAHLISLICLHASAAHNYCITEHSKCVLMLNSEILQ